MATARLIGTATDGSTGTSANAFRLTRFQALATGKITEFKLQAGVSAQQKIAIYADSSGEPGALLVANNTAQNVVNGWNTLSIPELNIIKDTYYWVSDVTSAVDAVKYIATGTFRYKSITFSSFTFPDPAGSGFSTANQIDTVAGWGILVLSPSGIAQPIVYGSPKLNLILMPSGIAQLIALGSPAVVIAGQTIQPSGIAQAIALGTPTVIKLLQILYPSGIDLPIAIGTPALRYPQTLSPSGIAQLVVFGTASVGVYGIIRPQGISVITSLGLPTILKYVWHVILDGQYATETPRINRAYVIGRDQYGNPVYGTAVDSTELGLVGERLDFQQELAIPTDAIAEDMAEAILAKMRLSGKTGVILIPPNCGQELFDVVQVTDSQANQSAVKFRVVGIRFEYNPKQARYQHRLILGAP